MFTNARISPAAAGILALGLLAGCMGTDGSPDGDVSTAEQAASTTTYAGRASVLKAQVLTLSAGVADTGPLPAAGGVKNVNLLTATVPTLLTAGVVNAFVVGQNDHTVAQASATNAGLGISVAGLTLTADVISSSATATCVNGAPALSGSSHIANLVINGKPIRVSGAPNQTLNLLVAKVIINEQSSTKNGTTGYMHTSAIRVLVAGLVDVSLVTSEAGLTCADAPTPPTPPTCTDGIKNGQETGVDCGGPACGACATGQGCVVENDCLSQNCNQGVCVAPTPRLPTCTDGIKNGEETGVDCGGRNCLPCSQGKACLIDDDCETFFCSGGVCVAAPTCGDGIKNGGESDVDCGGPTCPACADGKVCTIDDDCAGGNCNDSGICQVTAACVSQDWVTGQGTIKTPNGGTGNFSFYGELTQSGATGFLTYNDAVNATLFQATSVSVYTATGLHSRRLQGNGTLQGQSASFFYTLDVTDNGNSGDTFAISLSNGYGASGIPSGGSNIQHGINQCAQPDN